MDEKRAQFEGRQQEKPSQESSAGAYPEGASLCTKCNTKAAIQMDGCLTCLNCGDSKCG